MKKRIAVIVCIAALLLMAGCGSYVLAGTSYGIHRSPDNGASWTFDTTVQDVTGFAVSGSYLFAAASDGVYRSSDNGATWTSALPLRILANQPLAVSGSNIFTTTMQTGILYSTDNGATWTHAGGDGLEGTLCGWLTATSNYLIAIDGDANVWRLPLAGL
jgi:hypothetical protein